MLDGRLLVDAHLHPARLPTLKAAWHSWAEQFGQPGWRSVFDSDVYTASVPPDMIATTKQEIPNAVPNGANPLVIPVPEVRAAIGEAINAVLQGGDATQAANAMQKQVVQVLNG